MQNVHSDVPLLYIDNSKQSQKAVEALESNHKKFVPIEVKNDEDLTVPILFTTYGVFAGLLAITGYAISIFGASK
jgi:hypothetical protein